MHHMFAPLMTLPLISYTGLLHSKCCSLRVSSLKLTHSPLDHYNRSDTQSLTMSIKVIVSASFASFASLTVNHLLMRLVSTAIQSTNSRPRGWTRRQLCCDHSRPRWFRCGIAWSSQISSVIVPPSSLNIFMPIVASADIILGKVWCHLVVNSSNWSTWRTLFRTLVSVRRLDSTFYLPTC